MYIAHALKRSAGEEEQAKFNGLAIAQLDKVLDTNGNHIAALVLKGKILKQTQPEEAIILFEKALEIDKHSNDLTEEYGDLIHAADLARDDGDEYEAEDLLERADEVRELMASDLRFGDVRGPERLFDVKITLAEAHEANGGWEEASELYREMVQYVGRDRKCTREQYRFIFQGYSRCSSRLGKHQLAIKAGENAVAESRGFPGVHMLVAFPQRATGDLSGAIKTMSQAVLYEAPWDDENLQKNMTFLEELKNSA